MTEKTDREAVVRRVLTTVVAGLEIDLGLGVVDSDGNNYRRPIDDDLAEAERQLEVTLTPDERDVICETFFNLEVAVKAKLGEHLSAELDKAVRHVELDIVE